mmetsp:Transcript_13132/g.26326  ORF Transcript_13132/g.26326 Transcript_13132/m.26326 type:complete len:719 (-) Transcript_13132:289-2445(-)|eukprot:CAMPEP_0168183970 /NCGR_PEP_ID=MMETSP0139_2-20121125/12939_1 /TAXON_ID=44445 /ORGANISM="Pseudo-nitzschia australis, Strain 10249 10 AB" /LENGTH=718 /DNA_ID=CAMNT_0008105459 /DNA_START=155 /DNA_END=2311 /DNA_ORIENTATION=+
MTSHVSELSVSPGFVPRYNRYSNRYDGGYYGEDPKEEGPKQDLLSVQEENSRLKERLTRIQTECKELRDESKNNRAKVWELSNLVASSKISPKQKSAMKDSLIAKKKEKENADLTLALNQLEIELYQSELKLEEMQVQKRSNNKLLLEMGDVIRALNAIDVECDTSLVLSSCNNPQNLSPQQMSIRNIKLKIEAMTNDREQLTNRCKELERECNDQQHRVEALEAQFRVMNTSKISKGVSFGDAATYTTCGRTTPPDSPSSSSFASGFTLNSMYDDEGNFSQASEITRQTAEIVRYTKELALCKKKEQEQTNELLELKKTQHIQIATIQSLEKHNETISSQLTGTKEELEKTKDENNEVAMKRDGLKSDLSDIIFHYKSLNVEHATAQDQIKELQSHVDRLEDELQATKDRQEQPEDEQKENQEQEQEDSQVAIEQELAAKDQIKELQSHVDRLEAELQSHVDRLEAELQATNDRQEQPEDEQKENQGQEQEDSEIAIEQERDELKSSLSDVVFHYKALNVEHETAKDQMKELQASVERLEAELQETKDRCQQHEEQQQENEEQKEKEGTESSMQHSCEELCSMVELTVANRHATKRIEELETRLIQAGELMRLAKGENEKGDLNYQHAVYRYREVERERNDFQRKLNKALEETRLANLEAQKEREASKEIRRRLTSYLQKRHEDRSNVSCHSRASASTKKSTFKPLTFEELMKKDFS